MEFTTLLEHLRHPDKSIRGQAAVALGGLDGDDVLRALLGVVGEEPDFFVREDVTWALVRQGDAAVDPLIVLLRDPDPAVRHHAAHTLSKIGDPRAAPALVAALDDAVPSVVAKVAFTLGVLNSRDAIPRLVALFAHPDRDVQTQVQTALERFGADAVPAVTGVLHDPNPQVREQAADTLGVIGTRESVGALIPLLSDAVWQVRFAAVTALAHLGGAAVRAAVQPLANDPDMRVRQLAVRAAQRIRP